ncbi:hypothetical protein NBT05_03690 [Aquimarina sp. ERC-38]|uniref:hypothetical protein n=1 Tax=Aquimarina sp. ERC-38 TaxID=2949996 RepID=UPI0022476376|nr:hypothetical protein [Aquimarina sp. ERC-38]UZO81583.1 hypothetical protein NBT05_03690 [Aquimarina sp. ERC-38]
MKINWGHLNHDSAVAVQSVLETEYNFRTTVTKLFLQKLTDEMHDHLEDVQFDICPLTKCFKISPATPEPVHAALKEIMSHHLPKYKEYTYQA